MYNHMVGRTASVISPFYSLLPVHNTIVLTEEQGTVEVDTFSPDRLIWISNVATFNFLLNPLFLDIVDKLKTGFSKLESPSRVCV